MKTVILNIWIISVNLCIASIKVYTTCNGHRHCEVSYENFASCQPRPYYIVVLYKSTDSDNKTEKVSDTWIGIIVVAKVILVVLAIAIAVYIIKFRQGKGRKHGLSRNITPTHYHLATNINVTANKESSNDNHFDLEEIETEKVESHYMSTKEGVYDISNERRHKMTENTEIYDRSMSGVYDEANHKQTKDDGVTIYAKSSGDVYDNVFNGSKTNNDTNDLYETCEIKVRGEDAKCKDEV